MAPSLYGGLYQSGQRHFLSGSEDCPCLQLFPEGIPTAWRDLTRSAVLIREEQRAFSGNSSNRCEAYATKGIRQELCFSRRYGE